MRQVPIIFLFLITTSCYSKSQDTIFSLTGKVTDCLTKKNLKGVALRLICSDGRIMLDTTDNFGEYSFDNSIPKKNRAYVLATQPTRTLSYFSEKFKLATIDSTTTTDIRKDFCLTVNPGCSIILPVLHYEKNSATRYYSDSATADLDFLAELLKDNPTFVIEIGAHNSFDEENPARLSQLRVDSIQNTLIQKGIDKQRLITKVYGTDKPKVPKEELNKMKKKERDNADKTNRRIEITVLRKD
jgi:outer membrane protein OmpA-like peptidoglycan-associated protein